LALAESRRQQGYFKGFGYGEFGFDAAAGAAEEDSAEEGDQQKKEQPARASYQVKQRGPAAAEKPKASDSQKKQEAMEEKKDEQAIFKAFRDFYFKTQKEGGKAEADKKEEQQGLFKVSEAVAKFNKDQEQQQENNKGQNVHKAISYAYSTIEHNRYFPKVENKQQDSKKKADARSSEDDSGYYYYVKRY
jgi:hypothetical protein